jgi:hypothetical protein
MEMGLLRWDPARNMTSSDHELHRCTPRKKGIPAERLTSLQEVITDRPLPPIVQDPEHAAEAMLATTKCSDELMES